MAVAAVAIAAVAAAIAVAAVAIAAVVAAIAADTRSAADTHLVEVMHFMAATVARIHSMVAAFTSAALT